MSSLCAFAEIINNVVTRIIMISDLDCLNSNGEHDKLIGENHCKFLTNSVSRWVECTEIETSRKNPCDVGCLYDENADEFYVASPYASWILNSNFYWEPPIPRPAKIEGGYWDWDESNTTWVNIVS